MNIISLLLKELEQEAETTRKMLTLVPDNQFDWQPHPKSMTIKVLSLHIAELPSWVTMGIETDELDFASMQYEPTPVNSTSDLLEIFERLLEKGQTSLQNASEDNLLPNWTLRTAEQIHMVMTKYEVVRHSISQTIHHRAQLGVYLRLLNIPIPGSYGPSADEMNF